MSNAMPEEKYHDVDCFKLYAQQLPSDKDKFVTWQIETKSESFKFLTWQIETRSASPLLTPTTWAQIQSPTLMTQMIRSGMEDTNDLEDNIDVGDFDSDGDEGDGDLLSW